MKCEQWSNGLGWNVETEHGTAEVFDIGADGLKVVAPIAPEPREVYNSGGVLVRTALDYRYRVGRVPHGTDVREAIARTLAGGRVYDSWLDHGKPFQFCEV